MWFFSENEVTLTSRSASSLPVASSQIGHPWARLPLLELHLLAWLLPLLLLLLLHRVVKIGHHRERAARLQS